MIETDGKTEIKSEEISGILTQILRHSSQIIISEGLEKQIQKTLFRIKPESRNLPKDYEIECYVGNEAVGKDVSYSVKRRTEIIHVPESLTNQKVKKETLTKTLCFVSDLPTYEYKKISITLL